MSAIENGALGGAMLPKAALVAVVAEEPCGDDLSAVAFDSLICAPAGSRER